jgi:hypothetical protein
MKRNHQTIARLRDLRLHALRVNNHLHVTGISVHGCLVVPTRSFWSALSRIARLEEPDFGNEYPFFQQCLRRMGSRRLKFTVTVYVDKAQLLTDVCVPRSRVSQPTRKTEPQPLPSSTHRRTLPWEELLEAMLRKRFPVPEAAADELADESGQPDEHGEADWPLLAGFDLQQNSSRVWGWNLPSLPSRASSELLNGPEGTLRPSRN